MSLFDKLTEDFSFKSLWNNVGRWILPGGLLIDFMVDKLNESASTSLEELGRHPVLNSALADPQNESPFAAERDFVQMQAGPALAHTIDASYEQKLAQEHALLQAQHERSEFAGNPLSAQELSRMLELEKLFKGDGPSAEDLSVFAQKSIEKQGGQPLVARDYSNESGSVYVVYDAGQAAVLAREMDEAAQYVAKQQGYGEVAQVNMDTAAIMLARLNQMARGEEQTMGVLVRPNAQGDFELHAQTAPEMLREVQSAMQLQKETTPLSAGLQQVQDREDFFR